MEDKYSQYDSVLLKPLERLRSEERVGLAKDLLSLLSDEEWQVLLTTLPPQTREKLTTRRTTPPSAVG